MPSRKMLVLLAALAISGCSAEGEVEDEQPGVEEAPDPTPLDPSVAAALPPGATLKVAEEGRGLFVTCAVCHGFDGEGTQLGPSLRDTEWIGISGELPEIEETIRSGVADPQTFTIPMPALGGGDFTPEQVRALALYVYALSRSGS